MSSLDTSSDRHEYSGWKEAALVVCLGTTVFLMVSFLSPFWAVPATRDYDPNLEGIGLWRYCRWEQSDNTEVHVCRGLATKQPGKFLKNIYLTTSFSCQHLIDYCVLQKKLYIFNKYICCKISSFRKRRIILSNISNKTFAIEISHYIANGFI